MEEEQLRALNGARTRPKEFAAHLRPMVDKFDGTLLQTGPNSFLRTKEGAEAVREAIAFLERAEPLAPLERVSPGMCAAAAEHVKDVGASGAFGHTGSDGSTPFDRLNRHGKWSGSAAENIAYGRTDPVQTVLQLIVDDGVASRGHRKNIFNPDFRVFGVAIGPHAQVSPVTVHVFAAGYEDGPQPKAKTDGHASTDKSAGTVAHGASGAATASAPNASKSGGAVPAKPGKAGTSTSVKTSTRIEGKKKTITKTTTVTDAQGNSKTTVETRVEML